MDTRSAHLKAEHEPHGWHVAEDEEATASLGFQRGGVLMACPCGYHGWVDRDTVLVDA